MASSIHVSCIIFSLFAYIPLIFATGENYDYIKTVDPKTLGLKTEKLTHFRVYWQDLLSGPHPTSMMVVKPPTKSRFGTVSMINNALTAGPGLDSKLVGRAQGFYAQASQGEQPGILSFLMVMNFVFIEGKYKGSTISVLGRNSNISKVREMPVIGGSGLFRFARGYVEARTSMFNVTSGDATVEYTCYVLHY